MSESHNSHEVGLWFANDEGLYNLARSAIRRCRNKDKAARQILLHA